MKPQGNMAGQKSGHPAVRQKAPGPTGRIDYKVAKGPAPNSGHTARNMQPGSTNPRTDSGGGMGNNCAMLHKSICGK